MILDSNHFLPIEVDNRDKPFDRVGVAFVHRFGTYPTQRTDEPLASILLRLVPVVTRRPSVDHDEAQILDPSLLQRLAKRGTFLGRLLTLGKLVEHDRRLNSLRQRLEPCQRSRREIHHGFVARSRRFVQKHHQRLASDGPVRRRMKDELLCRLLERDVHEPEAFRESSLLANGGDRQADLLGIQGIERVARLRFSRGRIFNPHRLLRGFRFFRDSLLALRRQSADDERQRDKENDSDQGCEADSRMPHDHSPCKLARDRLGPIFSPRRRDGERTVKRS